ncbi:hypothetical protein BGZ80_000119 [Entomortierella chlamydospora]|uniref:Uncharacterized protein n=1 Tax=Entomortierella chlamydospora TaxID=101097 RepID=A0A9P6MSV7_9FUNG|nr:hypothetical protein BGZ80_000119 [Entomortierella chlamydospora]
MNSLVNYASESESESDESPPIVAASKQTSSASPSTAKSIVHANEVSTAISKEPQRSSPGKNQDHGNDDDDAMDVDDSASGSGDEGYVMAALKDLQSFAATVDTANDDSTIPQPSLTTPKEPLDTSTSAPGISNESQNTSSTLASKPAESESIESTLSNLSIELSAEQQTLFDEFLREIDAIPLTSKNQSKPPTIDKTPIEDDLLFSELQWLQTQSVQSIYSRMHQLSTLQSPTIDHKDMEARLIEFAIRILDWEHGGMKPEYFLGEERALAEGKKNATENTLDHKDSSDSAEEEDDGDEESTSVMPPYGGVVGEMLERMAAIEQTAAPSGWRVVWDPEECTYKFKHITTMYRSIADLSMCILSSYDKICYDAERDEP